MALFGTIEVIKERAKIVTKDMITHRNCRICILPDCVEIIGEGAFRNCKYLEKLIFVDENGNIVNHKIKVIERLAFSNTKIKKFIYSHYLTKVGEYAFNDDYFSKFQYYDEEGMESELDVANLGYNLLKDVVLPPSIQNVSLHDNLRSLLFQDKGGKIVEGPSFHLYAPDLREISLLGVSIDSIKNRLESSKMLNKIHVSMDCLNDKLCIKGRTIHFILYGETEVLDSFIGEPEYNTITVTFNGKAKEIKSGFLNGLANKKLVIPEGVEIIENIPDNLRNLKELELPSTLREISDMNTSDHLYSMKVTIWDTIDFCSYQILCSYLSPNSTIIIKGSRFTEQEKIGFRDLALKSIKLKFVVDKSLSNDTSLPILEVKEPIEKPKEEEESVSSWQQKINELDQELTELISLMPEDLKLKIEAKYNQILDRYKEYRKKEKEIINSEQKFLTLEEYDPYRYLYFSLSSLKDTIVLNDKAIKKLKQISEYRKVLNQIENMEIMDGDEILGIIQKIQKEVSKLEVDVNSCLNYNKIFLYKTKYWTELKKKIETSFAKAEKEYQKELEKTSGSKEFTPQNPMVGAPMKELKKELEELLNTIHGPIQEQCIERLKSFFLKSDNPDIQSLSDNIKTINYLVNTITDNQRDDKWDSLKDNYTELYWKMILKGVVDYPIKEEEVVEVEDKLREELNNLVLDMIEKREKISYLHSKIREIDTSYSFLLGEHEKEYTISSLIIEDIKDSIPDLDSISDTLDVKRIMYEKNKEIKEKLNSSKNLQEADVIMREYYDFLLELLFVKVSKALSYQKKGVVLQKR